MPCSAATPSLSTTILSAPSTVLILCAIIRTVLSLISFEIASCITDSLSTSSEAVASSISIIGASFKNALADDIFEKILKYKNYIYPNGGVTVTGGEPLLQVKFLIELFEKLKKENIHTCIDTSGMVSLTDDIKKLLSLTDLVLLDIKHIDSEKCKNLVGFNNERELAFARYLSDNNIHMWIRQVLVPGYTDDEQDLLKLKDFISTLKTVDKVEILPYHDMGRYKWEKLGLKYELDGVRVANDNDVNKAKKILGIS